MGRNFGPTAGCKSRHQILTGLPVGITVGVVVGSLLGDIVRLLLGLLIGCTLNLVPNGPICPNGPKTYSTIS